MAERKRRGDRDNAEGRDETDRPADDEEVSETAADESDDDAASDEDTEAKSTAKTGSTSGSSSDDRKPAKGRSRIRLGVLSGLVNFVREIVAELRKVIWPTRNELLTYTTVVVIFVAIMLSIVGLLDLGFAKAVLYVFGNGSSTDSE